MVSSKKKTKTLYDSLGRWVEEKTRIKGAIRRVFRLCPTMKEVLLEARVELPPALKKDGTPGARPQVRYRCAICGELFSQKNVNVDHINPVVALHKTEREISYDDIVRGIFCNKSNLQVLCSTPIKKNNGKASCHKIKTDKENYIRDALKKHLPINDTDLATLISKYSNEYELVLIEKNKQKETKALKRLEREQLKVSRAKNNK